MDAFRSLIATRQLLGSTPLNIFGPIRFLKSPVMLLISAEDNTIKPFESGNVNANVTLLIVELFLLQMKKTIPSWTKATITNVPEAAPTMQRTQSLRGDGFDGGDFLRPGSTANGAEQLLTNDIELRDGSS
jgi:hypothetical protein